MKTSNLPFRSGMDANGNRLVKMYAHCSLANYGRKFKKTVGNNGTYDFSWLWETLPRSVFDIVLVILPSLTDKAL